MMLTQVNLSPSFVERHPTELSGGQRQRVALARSLLLRPAALIADEPTSGLDPLVAAQILALLLRLKEERGLTLLLISHDLATVMYAADRVAVMYRGRIVELAAANGFAAQSIHPYTRFLLGMEQRLPDNHVVEGVHELIHE
jgi:ABC-type dipeptide/oligopeptide/nickel transport system ATPase subunit